jgi:hypothetical protein
MLREEAKVLATIGNSIRIRHSEVNQEPLIAPEQMSKSIIFSCGCMRSCAGY